METSRITTTGCTWKEELRTTLYGSAVGAGLLLSQKAGTHRFTAILSAEWRGVIGRSWNSKRPLVFAHVVLTKTLGVCRAKEIRARITRWMDLWERGLHAGLVGGDKAEGAARAGRAASVGEEENEAVARSYQDTVLSGKLRQTVHRETDREGGGCLLLYNQCKNQSTGCKGPTGEAP